MVLLTYGKGIDISTSLNSCSSFSNSYSILTSIVPSPDGEGQQFTKIKFQLNKVQKKKNGLKRWNKL
jgi:hypothetical protein